jgi:hypothetical protein
VLEWGRTESWKLRGGFLVSTHAEKLATYKGKTGRMTQSESGVYYFVETSNPRFADATIKEVGDDYVVVADNHGGQTTIPMKLFILTERAK